MIKIARIVIMLYLLGLSSMTSAASPTDDIRILIDVSGSMKKTDPTNLRVSALKLLNGLLVEGSSAGVWTFGRYVNMTVKWGKVNNNWRKLADLGAEEVHSNAMFTNIESALERSTQDWKVANPSIRRNLILLTDGKVDISKNAEKNTRSRQNILQKSIPRLKKAGVSVQAIALSADADEVLLKRLALDTGGSFEIAHSAADLQKIFFKMFERAVLPDTVEISDNQFMVDSSIREMTLLVFRTAKSPSTKLFSPDGKRYSARRSGKSVWRSDEGYDLVTIKNPAKGVWSIDADLDPDNRLMVVTDLRLEVADPPERLLPGQPLDISAALYNKDQQISKNSFLRFVEFNLEHTDSDAEIIKSALKHSRDRSQKGKYLYRFGEGLKEGVHSVVVMADSRTFNRSKRLNFDVKWPVQVVIKPGTEAGDYELSVSAREEYIDPGSLKVTADIESPDGRRDTLALNSNENHWHATIQTAIDGLYQIELAIDAVDRSGQQLQLNLGRYSVLGVLKPPPKEALRGNDNSNAGAETQAQPVDKVEMEVEESGQASGWMMTAIIVGVSNLFLVVFLGGLIFVLRRKPVSQDLILVE